MRTWLQGRWRAALRPALLTAALGLAGVLPTHLAISQYGLRQQANQALTGDAQSRAALAAVFLNDRRSEVRDLVDSGILQRRGGRTAAGGGADMAAAREALQTFARERRFGSAPCYSTLVFVSRTGDLCSETVPDAVPVSLTFEVLRSLLEDVYLRPAYQLRTLDTCGDVLVLSVAVASSGPVHGQLLAVLNPAVLDDRLQEAPAFARRSVCLVSEHGDVYVPRTVPREWRDRAVALLRSQPDVVTRVDLPAALSRPADHGRGLAVRTPIPASEFSLVCMETAAAIPTGRSIVWRTALYLALGIALVLGAPRVGGGYGWGGEGAGTASPREQRARCFEALFQHLPQGILVADRHGFAQHANRALLLRTGVEPEAVCGTPVHALLGEVQDAADQGVLSRALQGRQPWFGRMRQLRKDGGTTAAETAVLPVSGPEGEPVAVLAMQRDVTADVQVADRLRQAQKMEAVGVLTDGIAHDFNNLLTVIQGNCALLLGGKEALDTYARDSVEEILRACDRAAAMTRRLLAFSRHKGIRLEVVDLNEVVGSTEKMLTRLIRENVDMTLLLADDPVRVKADIVQLEQVIINLTVNARDAMPRGGRLTVRVARRAVTTRALGANLEEGEYAVLVVEDTGHGMDEATRRRIFEPFFTTKGEKEGTGLGLTTVQSIVKEHGGDVTVQSQVGLGTAFTVWLPLHTVTRSAAAGGAEETAVTLDTEVPPEPAGASPALSEGSAAGGGAYGILVLDDEESVLRMIERGLTMHGFRVYPARTDVDLLVKWEEHRDEIDLLITDMVMPGMSGVEVAARLRQDRPDLKVLSISAYTDTVITRLGGVGHDDMFFLQKPFTPDVLIRKVNHMLAAPGAGLGNG